MRNRALLACLLPPPFSPCRHPDAGQSQQRSSMRLAVEYNMHCHVSWRPEESLALSCAHAQNITLNAIAEQLSRLVDKDL
jgi:hypothetical protein